MAAMAFQNSSVRARVKGISKWGTSTSVGKFRTGVLSLDRSKFGQKLVKFGENLGRNSGGNSLLATCGLVERKLLWVAEVALLRT